MLAQLIKCAVIALFVVSAALLWGLWEADDPALLAWRMRAQRWLRDMLGLAR